MLPNTHLPAKTAGELYIAPFVLYIHFTMPVEDVTGTFILKQYMELSLQPMNNNVSLMDAEDVNEPPGGGIV